MAETRPRGEQLRFISERTGEHSIDSYLEASELGGRTLPDLMSDLFDDDGDLIIGSSQPIEVQLNNRPEGAALMSQFFITIDGDDITRVELQSFFDLFKDDFAPIVHTHAFSAIASKPTTLAGYGITDAALASHTHPAPSFASITGKPTTLAGYGITDGLASGNVVSFADLANTPTTLAGYGITNGALASHVHAFADLTSKPTTLAGYGITDASASGHNHQFATLQNKPTTLAGYGITDAAASAHTHAFSAITSKPSTLGGYGITDGLVAANNLSDLANVVTARANLKMVTMTESAYAALSSKDPDTIYILT